MWHHRMGWSKAAMKIRSGNASAVECFVALLWLIKAPHGLYNTAQPLFCFDDSIALDWKVICAIRLAIIVCRSSRAQVSS
jgi:hypothetical protein